VGDPTVNAVSWTDAVVLPAGMNTLGAERLIIVGLLLLRLTVTPFAGAACDSVIVSGVTCVIPMLVLLTDKVIEPGGRTVMFDIMSGNPGALALTIVEPAAIPVTLKLMPVPPAEMDAVGGTVAAAGLLELNVKSMTLGAEPESDRVSVPSPPPPTVKLGGDNVALNPTVTRVVAVVRPGADAVIVVVPNANVFRLTGRLGWV